MIMRKLLLLCFTLCNFITYAQTDHITQNWGTFKGKNFMIQHPENLFIYQDKKSGFEFIILLAKDETKSPFQENIFLLTDKKLPKNTSLELFKQTSLEELKVMIPDFQLIEENSLEINGLKFEKIIYSGKYDNNDLIMTQYYTIYNKVMYIINYTSVPELYSQSKELAEKIIHSYTFTK